MITAVSGNLYVFLHNLLFSEGFFDKLLKRFVQITLIIGANDVLSEFRKQRGRNIVECQVHPQIVFGGGFRDSYFLFHMRWLQCCYCFMLRLLKKQVLQRPYSSGERAVKVKTNLASTHRKPQYICCLIIVDCRKHNIGHPQRCFAEQ